MLELEISEEEEETGTATSIITDLKEEVEKLNKMLKIKDQHIRNLEEANLKLEMKLADKILDNGNDANNGFPALSPTPQRNYANAVTDWTQVKKPPTEQIEKSTRPQMITAQKKIESAFEGREMNSNAIQLKPINKGKIAIELSSEKKINPFLYNWTS